MNEREEFIQSVVDFLKEVGYENVEDMSVDGLLDAFVIEWNFFRQEE